MKHLLLFVIFLGLYLDTITAQYNWIPTEGPIGMEIRAAVFASDNALFVSGIHSGIYNSTDYGATWQKIEGGLKDPDGYVGEIAAGANGVVFATVGTWVYRLDSAATEWQNTGFPLSYTNLRTHDLNASPSGGLYIIRRDYINPTTLHFSADNGVTFKVLSFGIQYKDIGFTLFNGYGNNYISLVENGKVNLYRMNDDGSNFHKILNDFNSGSILWHPAGYLFYKSVNGFVRMDPEGKNPYINTSFNLSILKMLVKPNGNILIISTNGDYESDDLGTSFNKVPTSFHKRVGYNNSDLFFKDNDVYAFFYYCTNGTLERTSDGGITWTRFDHNFIRPNVENIIMDKNNRLFAQTCESDNYSYSLDQGSTWTTLNLPEKLHGFKKLTTTRSGSIFILSSGKLFKTKDLGNSWAEVIFPDVTDITALGSDQENLLYAIGKFSTGYLSKDGGETWNPMGEIFPDQPEEIYFHPDGAVFVKCIANSPQIFYYTEDEGQHWILSPILFTHISAVCIAGDGSIFISGKPRQKDYAFYKSTDKLNSIEQKSPEEHFPLFYSDGVLYGCAPNGSNGFDVHKTLDSGLNWESIGFGLPWDTYASGWGMDSEKHLYISFYNDVVYRTENAVVATNDSGYDESANRILIQPNPVENKMTITISNKNISSGHYKIIDINGIEKLKGDFHSNNFTVDCSSLANGISFIQLIGKNNFNSIEKIIILR